MRHAPGFSLLLMSGVLALVAGLLAGLGGSPASVPAPAAGNARPCRIAGHPNEIVCGVLQVPLRHEGGHETRALRWYRIPARARYPVPDPLVWIADGPGVDAVARAPAMAVTLSRILNARDLIWLEARGMPAAAAACVPPGPGSVVDRIDPLAHAARAARCRDEWSSWGGAAGLSVRQRAADLELLRRTLGLRQVNVLAEGSGARVAEAWARIAGAAMRAQVWDGPPPGGESPAVTRAEMAAAALESVFRACRAQPACHAAHPDPAADLMRVRAGLPANLEVRHPRTGMPERLELSDRLLATMLDRILRQPARAVALPVALSAAAKGEWQPLLGLAALGWARDDTYFSWGLWLAETCAGQGAGGAPDRLGAWAAWFYRADALRVRESCGGWKPSVPPAQRDLPLAAPVLVLTGGVDPLSAAPPPEALTLVAPGAGHGVLAQGCARDVVFRFIDGGGRSTLDAGCLERIPYPLPWSATGGRR